MVIVALLMVAVVGISTRHTWAARPVRSLRDQRIGAYRPMAALIATLLTTGSVANAKGSPGAFEMDAEFYLRNLLSTQKETKALQRGPIFPSPRTINARVADEVLGIMKKAAGGNISESQVMQGLSAKIGAFREFAPIKVEDTSDQYYFDLEMYVLYRIIAKLLPESAQRVAFRARVGDGVLDSIIARHRLPLSGKQAELAQGIDLILKDFQSSGMVLSYQFDSEDFGDEVYAKESLLQNLPISATIQLVSPVNVLSFIEGVKDNTFFHPEFIGVTLTSYIQRFSDGKYAARCEDYLLDNYYRDSNFDVQAQDVVLELRMGTQSSFS